MAGPSGSKKGDPVRIRDNQRRSRARRKAYVQELQEKHRVCEEMGIEASVEVHDAAKRVLRENKRLRALCRAHNIPQTKVDSFIDDTDLPPDPTAVATLEQVMLPRKPPREAPHTVDDTYKKSEFQQSIPPAAQCLGSAMPIQVKHEMDCSPSSSWLGDPATQLGTSMVVFPSMLTNTGYGGYGRHSQQIATGSGRSDQGNLASVAARYKSYLDDPWSYPLGSTRQHTDLARF